MKNLTTAEIEQITDFHWNMLAVIDLKKQYERSLINIVEYRLKENNYFEALIKNAQSILDNVEKTKNKLSIRNDDHLNALIEVILCIQGEEAVLSEIGNIIQQLDKTDSNHLSIRKKEAGWDALQKIAFYSPTHLKIIFVMAKSSIRLEQKIADLISNKEGYAWTFLNELSLFSHDEIADFQSLVESSEIIRESVKLYQEKVKSDFSINTAHQELHHILYTLPKQIESAKRNTAERAAIALQLQAVTEENWTTLHIIARYAPQHIRGLFELSKMSIQVQQTLSEIITYQNQEGFTVLHMMGQYCPNFIESLFKLAEESTPIKNAIIKAMPIKNHQGENLIHLLPRKMCGVIMHHFYELKATDTKDWASLARINTYLLKNDEKKLVWIDFFINHPEIYPNTIQTLGEQNQKGRTGVHELALYSPRGLSTLLDKALTSDLLQQLLIETLSVRDNNNFFWLHCIALSNTSIVYENLFKLAQEKEVFLNALVKAMIFKSQNSISPLSIMGEYALENLRSFFLSLKANPSLEYEIISSLRFENKNNWPMLHISATYLPRLVATIFEKITSEVQKTEFFEALSIQNINGDNAFELMIKYNAANQLEKLFTLAKTYQLLLKSIEKSKLVKKVINFLPVLFNQLMTLVVLSKTLQDELASVLPTHNLEGKSVLQGITLQAPSCIPSIFRIAEKNAYMQRLLAQSLTVMDAENSTTLFELITHTPEYTLEPLFKWSTTNNYIRDALLNAFPKQNNSGKSAISALIELNKHYFLKKFIFIFFDFIGRVQLDHIDEIVKKTYLTQGDVVANSLSDYITNNEIEPELSLLIKENTLLGALIDKCDSLGTLAMVSNAVPSKITSFFRSFIPPNVTTPYLESLRSKSISFQKKHCELLASANPTRNSFEYYYKILFFDPNRFLSHPDNSEVADHLSLRNSAGSTLLHIIICLAQNQLSILFGLAKQNTRIQTAIISVLFTKNAKYINPLILIYTHATGRLFDLYNLLGHVKVENIDLTTKENFYQHSEILSKTIIRYITEIKTAPELAELTDASTVLGLLVDQISSNGVPLRAIIQEHVTQQRKVISAYLESENRGTFLRRVAKDDSDALSILIEFSKKDQQTQNFLTEQLIFKPKKSVAALLQNIIRYSPKNLKNIFSMCSNNPHMLNIIILALSLPKDNPDENQSGSTTLLRMLDYAPEPLETLLKLSENESRLFDAIMSAMRDFEEPRPNLIRMMITCVKKRLPQLIQYAADHPQIKLSAIEALGIKDCFDTTGILEIISSPTPESLDYLRSVIEISKECAEYMKCFVSALSIHDQPDRSPLSIMLLKQEIFGPSLYEIFKIFSKLKGDDISSPVKSAIFLDKSDQMVDMLKGFLKSNEENTKLREMTAPSTLLGLLIDYQRGIISVTGTRKVVTAILDKQRIATCAP